MRKMLAILAFIVCVVPPVKAGDEENPFKKSKVGDWVEYKSVSRILNMDVETTTKMEIVAKSDEEVTFKIISSANGMVFANESKIDLTKTYDPLTVAQLPKSDDIKITKEASGKEKLTIGGKELDCRWDKISLQYKSLGLTSNSKIWISKDVPLGGMVKMESTSRVNNMDTTMLMILTGTGAK